MSVSGMEIAYQLMMGVSLAACAGIRAWMPMLALGIMARSGHAMLGPSFQFLASDSALAILAIATVLEILGDKFIVIDHFLDAVGTVARPVAGTILAGSMFTKMDPQTALVLGLIVGGTTALTVHTGKALTRAKVTVMSPFHGGAGNAMMSLGEDTLASLGVLMSLLAPVIAFFFALVLVALAAGMIYLGMKAGRKIFKFLFNRTESATPAPAAVTVTQ